MLNLNTARGALTSLRLLCALTALWLGTSASAQQPAPPPGAYDAAPYLGEVRNQYVYGDIWERPGLSARDRSMITVAVNQALYAPMVAPTHGPRPRQRRHSGRNI